MFCMHAIGWEYDQEHSYETTKLLGLCRVKGWERKAGGDPRGNEKGKKKKEERKKEKKKYARGLVFRGLLQFVDKLAGESATGNSVFIVSHQISRGGAFSRCLLAGILSVPGG